MMLDIDYFKNYNDYYGHQEGDSALEKIALVLKEHSKRVSDFAFRIGGEELGLIFSSTNPEDSLEFANNIKESVESLKLENNSSDISKYLTVSIGLVCEKAKNIENSIELYKLADMALYKAKKEGRNRVVMN